MMTFPHILWEYTFVSVTTTTDAAVSGWSGGESSVFAGATIIAEVSVGTWSGAATTAITAVDDTGYATVAIAGWTGAEPEVSTTQEWYIPVPDPAEGRSGFAAILLSIRERLSLLTGEDTSRVGVVVDPDRVPHPVGDWDLLLVPSGESPEVAIDGGGRYDDLRTRDIDIVLRSRNWSDTRESDKVALTDADRGHLNLEDQLFDAIELWTPTADSGVSMLALPIEAKGVSAPSRNRTRNQGWTSSTLSLSVSYLRNLTLPEATTFPTAVAEQDAVRGSMADILLALRERISTVCRLDLSRVILTSQGEEEVIHAGAMQDVLLSIQSESPESAIEGGGRYVNLRRRRIRLTPRTRSNLDSITSDLVKLTDASLGHFAMEDRLADAVELWIALDDAENALATPITVGRISDARHDSVRRLSGSGEWIRSNLDLELLYLRDLTLEEFA